MLYAQQTRFQAARQGSIEIVYRGVEYREALRVVAAQRYERAERRFFRNGARAKAVFGSGVYLVSNPKVAAEYAICHAETASDKAAVLRQELSTAGFFRLNGLYGENQLREDALFSRHEMEALRRKQAASTHEQWLEWTGEEVRSYLLESGYSGICYPLSPELTYYVSYRPQEQISSIELVAVLDLQELK